MLNSVKKHIYFYYILKIFTGLMSLAAIILFVNYAGQYVYGQYALTISIVYAVNNSLGGWIGQIILKFYTPKKSNNRLKKFLLFSIVISLLIGILIITTYFNDYNNIDRIAVLLLFIGIFSYSIYSTYLQKGYKFRNITFLEVIRTLILFSIPFILVIILRIEITITVLLITTALSYLSPLLFRFISTFKIRRLRVKNCNENSFFTIKKRLVRIYLSYGIPIGMWLGISTMLNVSDRYLIEYYFTFNEVGIYSSVYDITYKICTFALAPILTAIHPLIMNSYRQRSNDFRLIILKALKLEIKILPLLIVLIFVLSYFSNIALNIETYDFILMAVPILIGSFLWNFSMVMHKMLEVQNKTMTMLLYVCIALMVNIIGNIILLPVFGYIVAAYTTIASFLIYVLLVKFELKTSLND